MSGGKDREEDTSIGLQMKKARFYRRKTETEVAYELGISQASYRQYEQGIRMPRLAQLRQICEVLGTTPQFLLGMVAQAGDMKLSPDEVLLLERFRAIGEADLQAELLQVAETWARLAKAGQRSHRAKTNQGPEAAPA